MRFAFIRAENERQTFPVAPMFRVLRVSTSGYYAWLQRKPSERSQRKAEMTDKVKAAHAGSRGFRWGGPSPSLLRRPVRTGMPE